jgi:hypothetical protein
MAGDPYLKTGSNGKPAEQRAVQSSAGAGNAGNIPALDSSGRLDSTMMPVGIVPETITFTASEDLSAGDYVNLHLSTTLKGRKADNSNGRQADGFVLAAVSTGASGTLYTDGANSGVTGLTVAARYFLGTSGGVTATVPAAGSNVIIQPLGIAKSATELVNTGGFEELITRAA